MKVSNKRLLNVAFGTTILAGALAVFAVAARGAPAKIALPASYPDVGLVVLGRAVGDNAWSADGEWIGFPMRGPLDWRMHVWKIHPDGTGAVSLTRKPGAAPRSAGGVAFRPSGDFIVFVRENDDVRGTVARALAEPGIGLNCNLWAMTPDGGKSWQLTNLPTSYVAPRGFIHPQFSHDGKKLCWAEALGKFSNQDETMAWGAWAVGVADFAVENGTPKLTRIRRFAPGEQPCFYETHDWSPDDAKILFTGNLQEAQPANGLDLYQFDVTTQKLTRLTATRDDWDEHAHFSPDGMRIAWMSGSGLNVKFPTARWPYWVKYVKTELWIMNSDGSGQHAITSFNEPWTADYRWLRRVVGSTDRAVVSDSSWSPDGKKLAFTLAYEAAIPGGINSILVIMDLSKRNITY
ncbi:MAG: hypothetical protein AB1714_22745 [Acidobacteriota bacterium]